MAPHLHSQCVKDEWDAEVYRLAFSLNRLDETYAQQLLPDLIGVCCPRPPRTNRHAVQKWKVYFRQIVLLWQDCVLQRLLRSVSWDIHAPSQNADS